MSRPIQPSGIASAATTCVGRRRPRTRSAMTTSLGQQRARSRARRRRPSPAGPLLALVVLVQRRPDRVPRAARNVNAIAPPTRIASASPVKRSMTPILSVTFDAAEHDHERLLRRLEERSSTSTSAARSSRPRSAGGARRRRSSVGAVRGAERVVHVDVGQRASSAANAGSFSSSPGRSAGSRAAARHRRARPARRRSATGSPQELEQLGELARRAAARARADLALRPAEVRADDHLRAVLPQVLDRRERRPDARVVGDPVAGERDVEVGAHEDPPALDAAASTARVLHSDLLDQVGQAARVAPLVVVPRHDLDQVAVHHRELGVEDRAPVLADDVARDQRLLAVVEDTVRAAPRCGRLERLVDLVARRLAPDLGDEVDDRAVGDGDAHRDAVELAQHLGHDQADRLGGAGRGRDDVDRGGPGAAEVLVRQVEDLLVVRVRVHRGHEAALEPERLVQHLGERRQAVRRAGGVRDHWCWAAS